MFSFLRNISKKRMSSLSSSHGDHGSTPDKNGIYDVFMSFEDEDAPTSSFASDLYTSLQNEKVRVFKGDVGLTSENPISNEQILQAIELSRIYVIIFSRNYANSQRCLVELEKIMECYRIGNPGRTVLPVFYDVFPSEVCHQTGIFGEGFQNLLKEISVEETVVLNWRRDLSEAACISDSFVWDSRYEGIPWIVEINPVEVILKIVKFVSATLQDMRDLSVARHPVGVESRMQDVIQILDFHQSDSVLVLGIWGMGGIGKTTIARAIYYNIGYNFEFTSFLSSIREEASRMGLVYLQKQLLLEMSQSKKEELSTLDIKSGQKMLRKGFRNRKVLLVFDEVNDSEQLRALFVDRDSYGKGSIIIITTRDKSILDWLPADHVYGMKEMDESESLELFSWHTFKQANPRQEFAKLSKDVITYCGGLPLALEVLGSELYGKDIPQWGSVLEKLKRNPNPIIQQQLKLSYDGLSEVLKQIFLDIACFYVGLDVKSILTERGLDPETVMHVLVGQSLVTVDNQYNLGMHTLLQEMGREIKRRLMKEHERTSTFDVFLSFRGIDTRGPFTSHLFASLRNAGVHVFKDDDVLSRGKQISTSLLQAIEESSISIIVFSRNYANSKWCLLELEKIIECRRTIGQVVLPVFYDVDPSEVRNQKGMFGQAFEDLLNTIPLEDKKVLSWKTALHEAGGISGFVVVNSRNENDDINKIVQHVTRLLDRTELFVANHPVGVESRMQDVIQILHIESKDVLLVGISGMGGLGKTTIAKAIYNQIGQNFQGRSFLQNVREVWEQDNGPIHLQEWLLSSIYKTREIKINSIDLGKSMIKQALRCMRVLIVLDDVNKSEQLNALSGSLEWFGSGSRIIVTTRNEDMIRSVGRVCRMKEMDEAESVELFSWQAFKQASPKENFTELSREIVAYSGGLPLALEVLGSYLFDREIMEWTSVLKQLKIIPNHDVHKKLKISFDGLGEDPHDTKKEIFLDIACFFIGMDLNDVIQILKGCEFHAADIEVSILIDRSLVTIQKDNKIGMHDLLRDMGREIIREEAPREPEERSRLWLEKDVVDVLSNHMGRKKVEGLALKLPRNKTISLSTQAFRNMRRLRLLQLAGVELHGDFKDISRDLSWLCWRGFPFTNTPENFYQGSLAAIELEYSNLRRVWKKPQSLEKLTILNLSHSHHLIQTPDFSYLPNLGKLVLEDCPSLSVVSDTIGHLNKLLSINLKGCISLCNLPRSIYKLNSLKTLILSGCSKIDKLEEDLEQMESLTTLIADKTAITQMPFSIVRSKSIAYISFSGYEGFSRDLFPIIIKSWMSPTNAFPSQVQTSAGMPYLVSSDASNRGSHGSSFIFKGLQVTEDEERILEAMPHFSNIKTFALIGCSSEDSISGSETSLNSLSIQMGINCQATNTLRESITQKLTTTRPGECLLPGDNDPDWLTFIGEGPSVSFKVPLVNGRNLKTIMLYIVYSASTDNMTSECLQKVMIRNYTKDTSQVFRREELASFEEDKWQNVLSNLETGNKVEIRVVFAYQFIVRKTAVYLVHEEPVDTKMENCHAPQKKGIVSNDHKSASTIQVPVLPPPEHNESFENPDSEDVPPSPSIHKDPKTLDLLVREEEPVRDPIKGKAQLNFNVSVQESSDEEKNPLAELESLLIGSDHPSPKATFISNDAAIKEALYNLQCLLKNSFKSLLNDEELCRQLYLALDHLEEAEDKLLKEVVEVVASIKVLMPELVDHFNSVQATVNDQRGRFDRKEVLIKLVSEAKKRQEQLNTEVTEGKKEVDELDKHIQELITKRDMFKLTLEKCEGEKKKLKEEARDWLTECKGLLTAIKMNEFKYKTALREEANIQEEWEGFQRKLDDIFPPMTR